MLPKDRRVKKSAEFSEVFRGGQAIHGELLSLRTGAAADPNAPAVFGFVVGTRVSKLAVGRNRVKRRLRAIAASELTNVPAGTRVVVIAKPPAARATAAELSHELTGLAKRATLIR